MYLVDLGGRNEYKKMSQYTANEW